MWVLVERPTCRSLKSIDLAGRGESELVFDEEPGFGKVKIGAIVSCTV